MDYPGRIIKVGEPDAFVVRAMKERLNPLLVLATSAQQWLEPADPNFGPAMKHGC